MSLANVNPAFLVFIAAVILAWATYNFQSRQAENSVATRRQIDSAVNLMQQMAAQTGNQEILQEVIDAKTKLLASNRSADDDAVKSLLRRVPQLTEEYKKLEKTKATAADQLMAEYRQNWEPVIRFGVAEFDRRVATVTESGVKLSVTKDDNFKTAGIGQAGGNSQLIRVAALNGVELRLYCVSAQIHPTRLEAGHLDVTVRVSGKQDNESNPLSIRFDLKEASSGDKKFTSSGSAQVPNKDLTGTLISGINKGIEDFLVVASATKG